MWDRNEARETERETDTERESKLVCLCESVHLKRCLKGWRLCCSRGTGQARTFLPASASSSFSLMVFLQAFPGLSCFVLSQLLNYESINTLIIYTNMIYK